MPNQQTVLLFGLYRHAKYGRRNSSAIADDTVNSLTHGSRRRKIKCDGIRPQCGGCISRDIHCSWPEYAAPGSYRVASEPSSPNSRQEGPSIGHEPTPKRKRSDDRNDIAAAPHKLSTYLCSDALDIFLARHHAIEFCSFLHTASLDVKQIVFQHAFMAYSIIALSSLYMTEEDAMKHGYKSNREISKWHADAARQASRQSIDDISSKCSIPIFGRLY